MEFATGEFLPDTVDGLLRGRLLLLLLLLIITVVSGGDRNAGPAGVVRLL